MKASQTVLIVDDIKENVYLLMEILSEYNLISVLDGQSAINKAKQENNIDLILLDIMMPNLDGFDVCRQLKSNPQTAQIPIIFLTAKNKQEDIQRGFELGAVDYVTKPFNPNELISRVNTHLKLRAYEKDLEQKIKEGIEKDKIKEQMIHQQSKQASLGELLMHISHQWKQPLTSLASINLLNKTKLERGETLDKDEHLKSLVKSEDLIMYMSDTVETFQNFYKPSYENKHFFISECVMDVLGIVEATFYFNNIKIYVISHEDEETFGNMNEFSQVVFSILSNAMDVLIARNIKNPEIHIIIEDQKLSIRDNGGGIDEGILKHIFMPFISTHQNRGIGLYLAKSIVEKNNGIIKASNDKDGALFEVEFITWII
jgi:CheY-like chemotaxis protein